MSSCDAYFNFLRRLTKRMAVIPPTDWVTSHDPSATVYFRYINEHVLREGTQPTQIVIISCQLSCMQVEFSF